MWLTNRGVISRWAGCALALSFAPADAGAERLGWALGISNDSLGELRDRWQSSSVEFGVLTGDADTAQLPKRLGDLLEVRVRSDVITPADLETPNADDRRHAGVLAFGLHSYAGTDTWQARVGADLVVVGPQTGLLAFQEQLHEALGFPVPDLDDFQIGNTSRVSVSGEVARWVRVGGWQARPFIEARIGVEDLLRVGFDLTPHTAAHDLAMRTTTTGHRLSYALEPAPRWSPSFGADVALVGDSLFLPGGTQPEPDDIRVRVRAGLRYVGDTLDVFYGTTYLSEEFQSQPEGQFVGTLQVRFSF